MGLIAEVAAETAKPQCKVAIVKEALGEAEARELDELLDNRHDVSGTTILKVLAARGQRISINTLNRHRYAKDCACYAGPRKGGRRGGSTNPQGGRL